MKQEAVRAAERGDSIKIILTFWTDQIAEAKGSILPKHAWVSGTAYMRANPTHGIKAKDVRNFEKLEEIGPLVEQMLEDEGITLHSKQKAA